jgi:hypothetical protein
VLGLLAFELQGAVSFFLGIQALADLVVVASTLSLQQPMVGICLLMVSNI